MTRITTDHIKNLRQQTGVGMMEAKQALERAGGDINRAIKDLRLSGQKIAAAKSDRTVKEGVIGTYIHANGKVAALVALACETDFVARTEDFKQLAHELAMHVAAADPKYLSPADIPPPVLEAERSIYRDQLPTGKKPAATVEKIVTGKLAKYYSENCLLNQFYIRDDSLTINDLIKSTVAKLGENIQITSFARLAI